MPDTPETFDDQPEPVEAPEADEAQDLLQELLPALSKDDEQALADRVKTDNLAAISDRADWEGRLAEWDDAYYNRPGQKIFPWPGCANFWVPLTMMGVETYKPRLTESIIGQSPPILVVPSKDADERRQALVEQYLNWQVQTQIPLDSLVPQAAHLFIHPGLVVAKTYWKVTRHTRRMVREFPLETSLPDVLLALFGPNQPEDFESTGELEWEGTVPASPQGGPPLAVRLKMKFLEDAIQVLIEQETVDERPAVDLLEPVDLIVPANGGDDLNALPWMQHRMFLSEDELRQRVALGRFDADVVNEMFRVGQPANPDQPETDSHEVRQSQAAAEGVEADGASSVKADLYEILEDYRRWDVNNDGVSEEIISWSCPSKLPGRLLGWDYLDNVYAHGRRPFRVGRFLPIPFRFYGIPLAEMIRGIQDEINTIRNQRVDYGTLQNLPFYFYRASATTPPITQPTKPGAGIPVDNPRQDIMFPEWRGQAAFGSNEELMLRQDFERLSGLTDLSLGRQPNRVGATRTAKGTQTLLSEAGLRLKMALEGFQRFWIGVFSDILALDQEYLPPEQEFRVTGQRPTVMRVKDRTELRGQYDLRLATTVDQLNRDQMRQDATVLLQALMNPLAIQLGLVGQKGFRRAYADLLKSFGKNPDFYLEEQSAIRTPEEELMLFTVGQYVGPVMGENIMHHLETHQLQAQDPVLPPETRSLLARHLQETMQLARLMQAQQAMAGPGGNGARPPTGQGPASGQQAVNAEAGKAPQPLNTSPRGGTPYGG